MKSLKGLDKYEVIEERHIGDLNSDGYLLKHRKSGAYITLLLNDDENKVFYIGFRTPPKHRCSTYCRTYGTLRFERVPGKRSVY